MSLAQAKEHLQKYGLEHRIMEFSTSSATVKEAAEAIHCEEKQIVKTLSLIVENKPILIAIAGDCKINNSKFKAEFHTKAKMIPSDEVEAQIGHRAGGVCPFGVKNNVKIYLDNSLKKLQTLYPACGSANSAVWLK